MKNFLNHLLIQTIIDFKVCKKSARKSCCNWKTINEKKFINILKEQMLKSLLNHETKHQCINEYIKQLLNALKKIIEISTFWARSHEIIKAEWTKKCMKIIKNMQRMKRSCWIIDDWTEYLQACDKKSKIIKNRNAVNIKKLYRTLNNSWKNYSKLQNEQLQTHWLKQQFSLWSSQSALTSLWQCRIRWRWCFRFTFHHLQKFLCWTQKTSSTRSWLRMMLRWCIARLRELFTKWCSTKLWNIQNTQIK